MSSMTDEEQKKRLSEIRKSKKNILNTISLKNVELEIPKVMKFLQDLKRLHNEAKEIRVIRDRKSRKKYEKTEIAKQKARERAKKSYYRRKMAHDSTNSDVCQPEKPTCDFVECDICHIKNINPDDLDEGDLNLSLIGKGYAHEYCMSDDDKKEYVMNL